MAGTIPTHVKMNFKQKINKIFLSDMFPGRKEWKFPCLLSLGWVDITGGSFRPPTRCYKMLWSELLTLNKTKIILTTLIGISLPPLILMLPGCQESGNMMCNVLRHPPHCSLAFINIAFLLPAIKLNGAHAVPSETFLDLERFELWSKCS